MWNEKVVNVTKRLKEVTRASFRFSKNVSEKLNRKSEQVLNEPNVWLKEPLRNELLKHGPEQREQCLHTVLRINHRGLFLKSFLVEDLSFRSSLSLRMFRMDPSCRNVWLVFRTWFIVSVDTSQLQMFSLFLRVFLQEGLSDLPGTRETCRQHHRQQLQGQGENELSGF